MESHDARSQDDLSTRARAPSRRVAMRVIQDGVRTMAVYEMERERAGEPRSLVFETPDSWIRLDEFPADWHRLSDDELLSLRSGRE